MAEPQSGMFDILTWALVLVALAIGDAPAWLIVLKAVIGFGILAAGVAAYLRARGLPAWAYTWAALALVLAPRFDKLKDQSALWPAVFVGWLLWAIDGWLARPRPRSAIGLGLWIAVMVNAGYPPTTFRLALLVVPYVVVELVRVLRAAEDRRGLARALGRTAPLVAAVVLVCCAGQVWSTLDVLGQTKRASLGLDFVLASRTAPEHLVGLFAPFENKQALNLYASAAGVIGVGLAVVSRRPIAIVLVSVALLGFVLGCGDDLPVLPALAKLPGFRSFRIAGHYLILTSIGWVLAAAWGLASVATSSAEPGPGRKRALVTIGIVVALEVVAYVALVPRGLGFGTVVLGLTATTIVALGVWPRLADRLGWVLVSLTAIDLMIAARPVAEILQPLPDPTRGIVMAEAIDRRLDVRVADFEWAGRRVGPREGIRDLLGHRPALTDPRYMMITEAGADSAPLLRAMNVGLAGFSRGRARATRQGQTTAVPGQPGLFVVSDPWPLAFFTDRVEIVDGPTEALASLRRRGPPRAVFERGDAPEAAFVAVRGSGSAEPVELVRYDLAELELRVEAARGGVLVVTESFEAGWHAEVDGAPVEVVRANLIGRAVVLEPGVHRVVMRYAPRGVRALWWCWLLGSLATFALAWRLRDAPAGGGRPSRQTSPS